VEEANVRDVDSAEKLALAAYKAGDWEGAQRWIDRARATPAAQWLQAKLLLRGGRTDAAAALLAKVAGLFPPEPPSSNAPAGLFNDLTVAGSTYLNWKVDAAAQVSGELGCSISPGGNTRRRWMFCCEPASGRTRLTSRNVSWTGDELKDYVARNWPALTEVNTNSGDDRAGNLPKDLGPEIRVLLARRLARLNRAVEARDYFTPALRADYDRLEQSLARGADTALSAGERAGAYYAAAKMTRTNGMELLGTELGAGLAYLWREF